MKKLSKSRKVLLQLLLGDPTISSKVLMGNELAKSIAILDDGSIRLGRSKWWLVNLFTRDERTISLLDIAVATADAITGFGNNRNNTAFDWIIKDIIQCAVKEGNYDKVVDVLWDSVRHGFDGELASKFIPKEEIDKACKDPRIRKELRTGTLGVVGRCVLNSGSSFDVLLGRIVQED